MVETAASDAYGEYYRHVELAWSLRREHQIIVSPVEFEKIEEWYEAGVPLAVVLEAINVFIEKKKKAKRQTHFLLTHVHTTVTKLYQSYLTLHEGENTEEGDLLEARLKSLTRKLRALGRSRTEDKPFIEALVGDLNQIDGSKIVRFEDLDSQMEALDTRLIEHFSKELSKEDAAAIREEVEEYLTEEEDPEFFKKMLHDSVRAFFDLPRLTLLG